ncbi:hypothetical protein BDV18DRAFT_141535 [Aspergillus unguis]
MYPVLLELKCSFSTVTSGASNPSRSAFAGTENVQMLDGLHHDATHPFHFVICPQSLFSMAADECAHLNLFVADAVLHRI